MSAQTTPKRPHRVETNRTRALLGEEAVRVENLSLGGARLGLEFALSAGEVLPLLIRHPHLDGPAKLRAEVVWCSVESSPMAGIRFLDVNGPERIRIRRCMLAEFGSSVLFNQQVVGYLVAPTPRTLAMFDLKIKKVADLRRAGSGIELACGGKTTRVGDLSDGARLAFGLSGRPRIDPPIDWTPPSDDEQLSLPATPHGDVGLNGSCVLDRGQVLGYVALTRPGSWSFYDANQEPIGFMTREEMGKPFCIVLLGGNEDGSVDLRQAPSYPEAIGRAFGLEGMPELRSAVIRPVEKTESG